jgi:hypothetical protein
MRVGEEIIDRKSQTGTEIPRSGLSPLPNLWATAGILAKVPNVPYLLSFTGITRRNPWSDQGKLVTF